MKYNIAVLKGDGIGPEVVDQTIAVLNAVGEKKDIVFNFREELMGGCAIDAFGEPLPQATLKTCRESDAVLLGAVGGPKWEGLPGGKDAGIRTAGYSSRAGAFAKPAACNYLRALKEASPAES